MRTIIIIPARYGSSRLPGKPLVDILGKPMIRLVYERASLVKGIAEVVVATDHALIAGVVTGFGGKVEMTSENHPTGSDRLVEVMGKVSADLYINLQCDEPLVRPEDIECLVAGMQQNPLIQVGTLCHYISLAEAQKPHCVKVVLAASGEALYFSRSPIPYARDIAAAKFRKHIGVYAFRPEALVKFGSMPRSMLEQAEMLEQLRLLEAGIRVHVFEVAPTGPGVDNPASLAQVCAIIAGADPA
ncbi:MAG: 3-deoxy-D-manno-octulosonate cytidylyltransferase [Deltaproteobacteria bacterium RIFOXYD12_FULL_50_9]|nr:MAG: 3-deoxy-D-manno-octulosonate cytidylyltransferase [Deltaproteobacteria bacterium RIFOXYD12_FULL_50_9]